MLLPQERGESWVGAALFFVLLGETWVLVKTNMTNMTNARGLLCVYTWYNKRHAKALITRATHMVDFGTVVFGIAYDKNAQPCARS